MNILGVGPAELVVVLIVLLVVAGPKRMIEWAYYAGRYTTKLRAMFQETMDAFQKEMAQSGIEIPKELSNLPTGRFDILSEAAKVINSELAETTAALNAPLNATPSTTPAATPTAATTPSAPSAPTVPQTPATPGNDPQPTKPDDEQSTRYDSWIPN